MTFQTIDGPAKRELRLGKHTAALDPNSYIGVEFSASRTGEGKGREGWVSEVAGWN